MMMMGAATHAVIFKHDTDPVDVALFESEPEARDHYDRLRLNWTETWLVEVIEGPGKNGLYRRPLGAQS